LNKTITEQPLLAAHFASTDECSGVGYAYTAEFLYSQVAIGNCTINDVLFTAIGRALNNEVSLMASSMNIPGMYTPGMSVTTLVHEYVFNAISMSSWQQDFWRTCMPMMNELVETIFNSTLMVDVSGSGFARNASSSFSCDKSTQGFYYDPTSMMIEFTFGNVNMQPVVAGVESVLGGMIGGSLGQRLTDRFGFCRGERLNGDERLTDQLFLQLRNVLTGNATDFSQL
jgi:hypothetical protein